MLPLPVFTSRSSMAAGSRLTLPTLAAAVAEEEEEEVR
jgi:hypothetical protein